MSVSGQEIHGVLNTADASSGVEVPIYRAGEATTAITLNSNEFIEVTDVFLVSVPAGDVRLFFGSNMTPAVGSDIIRGTVGGGNNVGSVATSFVRTGRHGPIGNTVRVLTAASGEVNVIFTGRISKA